MLRDTRKCNCVFEIFTLLFHFRNEMACSNVAMIKNISSSLNKKLDRSSCLLHTFLEEDTLIGCNSVTEYSWLGKGCCIGEKSIVSNVFIPSELSLPDNVFLHTVCVLSKSGSGTKYVTVAFGIKDNVKKTCSDVSRACDLKWNDRPLDAALVLLRYPKVMWL